MSDQAAGPDDAKTVQWAPDLPLQEQQDQQPQQQQQQSITFPAGKMPQASTGACDACRARKVRCLANESSSSSKCQRCARAGRECVYTVHSKTRRRKRTDTRVKELEEKVKSLSLLLEQGKAGKNAAKSSIPVVDRDEMADDDEEWSEEGEEEDPEAGDEAEGPGSSAQRPSKDINGHQRSPLGLDSTDRKSTSQDSTKMAPKPDAKRAPTGSVSPDVVERGLLTMEKAQVLFDRYSRDLAPHYPAVVFPQETTAARMRTERPILFLAAVAAGASNQDPALNMALNQEIMQVYAHKVALKGEKSLELVMSILISTLWYYPPDKFEELKFHQYIHMAATMALDIGIGKRPRASRPHETRPYEEASRGPLIPDDQNHQAEKGRGPPSPGTLPNSAAIECRRTLLACYVSCAGVSLSLRLPNMLRFTSWMSDCVDYIDSAPEAAPTDKRFAAWIRVQRLAEECIISFSLDDPGNTVSLQDTRVQQMLKGYEKQFELLSRDMRAVPGLVNEFLEINIHVNNVFMHEIALHPEHDSEDFRPPFFISANTSKTAHRLSPVYTNALAQCISSAQIVIETFTGMHVDTARAVPALLYVRIIYCSLVLIKLDVSANTPSSQIGQIIDRSSLMTRPYIEKALLQLKRVAGNGDQNPLSAKFCMILGKLVNWYRQTIDSKLSGTGAQSIEPCQAYGKEYNPQEIPSDLRHALVAYSSAPAKSPNDSTIHTTPAAQYDFHQAPGFNDLMPFQSVPHYPTPQQTPHPSSFNPIDRHPIFTGPPTTMSEAPHAIRRISTSALTPISITDHSSAEFAEQYPASKTPYPYPMTLDQSLYPQLQPTDASNHHIDPNDWIFDGSQYHSFPDMAVPEFNWTPMPGQQ